MNNRSCTTIPRTAVDQGSGFTLIELLAVMAIIGILIFLLFPSVTAIRKKSQAAKCISNLRSIGSAIRLNSIENNGRWVFMESMYETWDRKLRIKGHLSSDGASFCPSCEPGSYAQYQTYGATWQGIALPPDDQNIIKYIPTAAETGPRTYYDINLMAISNPSRYLLMADSYTTRFKSQYHIVQGNTGMDEIHMRHDNRANILFADGHVDALDKDGLRDIGWTMAFDEKGTLIRF